MELLIVGAIAVAALIFFSRRSRTPKNINFQRVEVTRESVSVYTRGQALIWAVISLAILFIYHLVVISFLPTICAPVDHFYSGSVARLHPLLMIFSKGATGFFGVLIFMMLASQFIIPAKVREARVQSGKGYFGVFVSLAIIALGIYHGYSLATC